MSGKSTKLNRGFDAKILVKARKIAERYEIILTEADGEWYGKGVEMPTVFGDGKTPDECIANTREALVAVVAHLIEKGSPIPAPASEGKRTEQVNVRVTPEEKVILASYARSQGFRGIGDFMRARAIGPQSA